MNLTKPDFQKWVETLIELRKPLYLIALLWGASLILMLISEVAKAELRCDCSQVVGSCSAAVSLDGMQVSIESNSDACSRVDYLIDGQPFAALVVGGSTAVAWPGQPLRSPQIIVENCRVCAESGDAAMAADGDAGGSKEAAADSNAQAIVKVMPEYPREAWTNLIEGMVTVEFNVNPAGQVENIRVTESSSPVFVTSSMDAISRFRYLPARQAGAPVAATGKREQFLFRIVGDGNPVVSSREL